MKKVGIGVLGCGVIGSAVVKNLIEGKSDIMARCGAEIEVRRIAELNPERKKAVPESARGLFTDKLDDVLADGNIDIVVELMGGIETALKAVIGAISNGKHVVTANKHLLAKKGEEIFSKAAEKGVQVNFEASVAGAVPVIRTLKEGIAGGKILSINGIINGTANYILSKMSESDVKFADVLAEAQKLGYAEADPTFDIEGIDAAHKIAILASLAYGTPVDFDSIYVEGISRLEPDDFVFAKQFGKIIKLLGIANLDDGQIEVRVHPVMLPNHLPIARVDGVTNAVGIEVSHAGNLMLIGPGAGGNATSSAVIADIVEIARDIARGSVGRVAPTAFLPSSRKKLPMKRIDDIECGYYIRFRAFDKPGVLARIAGVLGEFNISIESAYQKNIGMEIVPLVIITHVAREKDLKQAVAKIENLDVTKGPTLVIRQEDG